MTFGPPCHGRRRDHRTKRHDRKGPEPGHGLFPAAGQIDGQPNREGPQKAKGKSGSMPKGLAKKGKLPPGLAKRKELPPGLASRGLPTELEQRLPPPRQGTERKIIEDGTVLLVEAGTNIVLDILEKAIRGNK